MAVDKKNLVYTDDANNTWLVRNMAAYLTDLGFIDYDPTTMVGLPELPSGFRMRQVNMIFLTASGKTRSRTFPCGNITSDVYKGDSTFTLKTPGLASGGTPADAMNFVYRTSSTRGEIRNFLTKTDPGYTELVAQEVITSVTPSP